MQAIDLVNWNVTLIQLRSPGPTTFRFTLYESPFFSRMGGSK